MNSTSVDAGTVFRRSNTFIARYSDVLLALAVVVIIGTMIVKVPQGVMDYLIAINLGISVAILLAALYIPDASRFPSFPTVLLLTTLFRLALNVSTTKLILLDADAGQIISAFGNFVVQGNFVVGGVVFLVLVLVQFIVITKGAERVAEVSARFTLDAMPGNQMSIDAEQRSGSLTPEQAKRRRQDLERESKLYGAMEGAMKFVKGDAIAAICITLVNVIGGLIVGVTQQGMSVGESAQVFSLLTIGDGLVSQVPSLLIGVAAGLVVTRVAADREDASGHVAGDIVEQVLGQHKAVFITAALLVGLAVLGATGTTGLPAWPFLALAAVMVVGTVAQFIGARKQEAQALVAADQQAERSFRPMPLTFAAHRTMFDQLARAGRAEAEGKLRSIFEGIRQDLIRETGVPFPEITLRTDGGGSGSRHVPPNGYAMLSHDVLLDAATFDPSRTVLLCDPAIGKEIGVSPISLAWTRVPAFPIPQAALPGLLPILQQRAAAGVGPLQLLPAMDVMQRHVRFVLQLHAPEAMGMQETSALLDQLRETHEELVKAVTPTLLSLQQLVEVLRGLLREQVPIRDLRGILESIARRAPMQKDRDVDSLVERVRRDMARTICDRFAGDGRNLEFYSVDVRIEQALDQAGRSGEALKPAVKRQIFDSVGRGVNWSRHVATSPVLIVANPYVRRPLRKLLEDYQLYEVAVLSYEEQSPEFVVKSVGVITELDQDELDEGNGPS